MSFLRKLFGLGPAVDFANLKKEGAVVVDVRSKEEFKTGHIDNAINIPVDSISKNLGRFKNQEQVIITCCASGMRSSRAKSILKSEGFKNVHNGGAWSSLKRKLN